MKISLVVPVHNAEEDLPFLFRSLSMQKRPFDEVVFSDNGSADRSKKLCEEFASKERDYSVSVIEERNPGPGPARNAGIRRSSGDIICFTDSDCAMDADYAFNVEALFRDNANVDLAGGVAIQENPFEKTEPRTLAEEFSLVFWSGERSAGASYPLNSPGDLFSGVPLYITTFNMACRRSVCEALEGFSEIPTMEDIDFWLRACGKGFRSLAGCPELKVFHRNRTSVSSLVRQQYRYIYNLPWLLKRHFRGRFFIALQMKKIASFPLVTGFLELNPHTLLLLLLAADLQAAWIFLFLLAAYKIFSMSTRLKKARRYSFFKSVFFAAIMEMRKLAMTAASITGSIKHRALCLL